MAVGVTDSQGDRNYRGICLVGVLWKVVMVIPNRQFTASITFHEILHGFQDDCGTGTTFLEANLLHQLMSMRG